MDVSQMYKTRDAQAPGLGNCRAELLFYLFIKKMFLHMDTWGQHNTICQVFLHVFLLCVPLFALICMLATYLQV